jgi:hypothetical protein
MKITDNGTLVTLGLVGVVAAVGAANQAGFYGSSGSAARATRATRYRLTDAYDPRGDLFTLAEVKKNLRELGETRAIRELPDGRIVFADEIDEVIGHSVASGSRALGGKSLGYPHAGPSIKRMQDMLQISKEKASALKGMMDDGKSVSTILREADRALNGHGVEYIDSREDTMRSRDGISYVNMGDTYDTTLLFDHKTGRFSVGAWGDVVERQPRRFE